MFLFTNSLHFKNSSIDRHILFRLSLAPQTDCATTHTRAFDLSSSCFTFPVFAGGCYTKARPQLNKTLWYADQLISHDFRLGLSQPLPPGGTLGIVIRWLMPDYSANERYIIQTVLWNCHCIVLWLFTTITLQNANCLWGSKSLLRLTSMVLFNFMSCHAFHSFPLALQLTTLLLLERGMVLWFSFVIIIIGVSFLSDGTMVMMSCRSALAASHCQLLIEVKSKKCSSYRKRSCN